MCKSFLHGFSVLAACDEGAQRADNTSRQDGDIKRKRLAAVAHGGQFPDNIHIDKINGHSVHHAVDKAKDDA